MFSQALPHFASSRLRFAVNMEVEESSNMLLLVECIATWYNVKVILGCLVVDMITVMIKLMFCWCTGLLITLEQKPSSKPGVLDGNVHEQQVIIQDEFSAYLVHLFDPSLSSIQLPTRQ